MDDSGNEYEGVTSEMFEPMEGPKNYISMKKNKVVYIADYGREENEEDLSLIKIENYQAYEYFDKKWHEAPGLYSMLNDPGPWAEQVNENRVKEIMKTIDKFD